MAQISKITLPSGNTYDIKDSQARADIETIRNAVSGGVSFLGITTTPLTDGSTVSTISINGTDMNAINGALVMNGEEEYVWSDTDDKWHRLGPAGTFGTLAYQDAATGTVTPSGTVSRPTFTGTAATISVTGSAEGSVNISTATGTANYTPGGTVSQPNFTGTAATVSVTGTPNGSVTIGTGAGTANYTPAGTVTTTPTVTLNTTTVNSITGVGTLPSWTGTVTNENLTIGWDEGTLPTQGANTTVATGVKSATASSTFSGTGTQLQATFSGAATTLSGSYTPAGSVSQPTFTGAGTRLTGSLTNTDLSATGTYTPAGTVSQPTFTGNAATVTVS